MVIDQEIAANVSDELKKKREFIRSNFPELRGKTLGCWCCDLFTYPLRGWGWDHLCHAVVLARLAEGDLLLDWRKTERPRRRRKKEDPRQRFNFGQDPIV